MNFGFIKKIVTNKKHLLMRSEIQEFRAILGEHNIQKNYLKSFKLFEEFSGRSIIETIKERRLNFKSFDAETERLVETEIESFYDWLKEVKGLHQTTAHYYSVSLKSLLAGLPIGVEVGLLFGIILDAQAKNPQKNLSRNAYPSFSRQHELSFWSLCLFLLKKSLKLCVKS